MRCRGGSLHKRMQAGRAASNRPDLSRHVGSTGTEPARVPVVERRTDWPRIASVHPTWWQVWRIELHQGARRDVLIAECRTEVAAFDVVRQQLHRCTITRWRDRQPPYVSMRPPLVVA